MKSNDKTCPKADQIFSHGTDGTTILTYKALLSSESFIHRIVSNNKDMEIVSESDVNVAW